LPTLLKPGIPFDPDMVKQFLESRGTGFYFRVLQEGEVGAGDTKRVGEPGQQQYHWVVLHSNDIVFLCKNYSDVQS
jgi:MOSC domain-containing protein YiiM